MKITEEIETFGSYDERQRYTVFVDGEEVFSVHDGEPEDSNLNRDFSDCLSVASLMQDAYDRGFKEGRDNEL